MKSLRRRRYLALIPARGGSKGIYRKNLAPVNGRPLIQYTLDVTCELLSMGAVDSAVVSTDDEEIAAVASAVGIAVPFLRPTELATDRARAADVVLHALNFLRTTGVDFDAVVLLQPTAPQRTVEDVVHAINLFDVEDEPSLFSVYEAPALELHLYRKAGKHADPLHSEHASGLGRQVSASVFVRNGAVYIARSDFVRREGKLISDRPLLFEMPRERSLNIDEPFDLQIFRCIQANSIGLT